MMVLMVKLAASSLNCRVVLVLVPDEESGGERGTAHLVKQGIIGDIAICGEPTNLNIAVQAKGILQLLVEVPGVAAHGSRPWLGTNAILKAMDHFRKLTSLPFFQESTLFFHQPSLNLAKIQAGHVFNQVPDRCALGIDIRYLPGQNPDDILKAVREVMAGSEVRVHFHGTPVETKTDDVLVSRLCRHAGASFFGQDGSADTRFYAEQGIPAVEFGPAGANHHGPGEYVDIASLCDYVRILHEFILHIKDDEQ
ncbi:M20 family metallopeptidase [Paenibacillus beijingensis]|uniref:M20 family metallopeptidase n=1 Tax=Paenibacillus beijingensis TaxID=1126833 RepID=UPI000AC0966C|nr:M20/M25/M40 family metallo-hydrolase [Paenibacillus beijingensis]